MPLPPYLAGKMLRLDHISLFQFKNYLNRSFDFRERVVGIYGNNGVGKTNLLDAIHYLCFTKSYFTRQDGNNVKQGCSGFRVEGHGELNGTPEKVVCILRETGRKEFAVNDEAYEKFSRHIGRYPCVVIAPDDAQLITGDSRERRTFLDELLSQLDADYLQDLITYTRVLQQRNSLLKRFAETNTRDEALLEVLDEQLIKPGEILFTKRRDYLLRFLPAVKQLYLEIARQPGNTDQPGKTPLPEAVQLVYESELLLASFRELLKANRQRDLSAQRTCAGIHRDDLEIQLGSQSFKSIASQGQRKSLLFALKLAEMESLKKEKGFPPLLLLDDVFEKLDEERIANLLRKVCIENDGQVFITDTHEERLKNHLEMLGVGFQLIGL